MPSLPFPYNLSSVACCPASQGTTRLLLTKIPMFKEVVVSSFHCPHCGAANTGIQSGAAIEDQGVRYTFRVHEPEVQYLAPLLVSLFLCMWSLVGTLPGLVFFVLHVKACFCESEC